MLGLVIRGPLVDVLRGQLVGARAGELKKRVEGSCSDRGSRTFAVRAGGPPTAQAAPAQRAQRRDEHASTGPGQGVQLLSVFQNISQISDRWGRDRAETIVANQRQAVRLGDRRPRHPGYLRAVLGEEEIERLSTHRQRLELDLGSDCGTPDCAGCAEDGKPHPDHAWNVGTRQHIRGVREGFLSRGIDVLSLRRAELLDAPAARLGELANSARAFETPRRSGRRRTPVRRRP